MMKKLGGGGNRASANHVRAPPSAPGCMGVHSSHAYKSTTFSHLASSHLRG
ncbi:MAG: hypothetical protein MJE68_31815 [Proteobacteria bacterium]|nr:hypothetical protein [Pseudomonadota bacterium]